jgi:hypothetical protein
VRAEAVGVLRDTALGAGVNRDSVNRSRAASTDLGPRFLKVPLRGIPICGTEHDLSVLVLHHRTVFRLLSVTESR